MRFQWLTRFCDWLEQTAVSQTIQSVSWIVPTVQSIHILAVAVVIASGLMIALRAWDRAGRDQSPADIARRFLPCIWWALVVLLATGLVMIVGEPTRALTNWVFQLKMLLIVAAIAGTAVYQQRTASPAAGGAAAGPGSGQEATAAALALLLWIGIIFAGRWIAYV